MATLVWGQRSVWESAASRNGRFDARQRRSHRPVWAQASAASGEAAAAARRELDLTFSASWAAQVTHHTLTLPQVLEHLEQLERIEAATGRRAGSIAKRQPPISWVLPSALGAAASLTARALQGLADDVAASQELAEASHPSSRPQDHPAAPVLRAWRREEHTKPEGFDADAQLTLPGLADVAVVSRGGWQRRGWKSCNQDAFLALPLAVGGTADCPVGPGAPSCCSTAAAIGVFDGHGRAGEAASSHLRNALASGLLMHSQLAAAAQQQAHSPAQQAMSSAQHSSSSSSSDEHVGTTLTTATCEPTAAAAAAALAEHEGTAQLLERCFAAAADTMPLTGADLSLSGSTAVLCLVQPGRVTAAWAGDSRAVLGLHHRPSGRLIACALTHDHRPCAPLERARIEAAGGWVMQTALDDEGRPCGPHRLYLRDTHIPGLAVSRAFGDYVATAAGVTATPDITTLMLPLGSGEHAPEAASSSQRVLTQQQQQQTGRGQHPRTQQRQQGRRDTGRPSGRIVTRGAACNTAAAAAHHILVVASDGLWEFVSNADAVAIAGAAPTAKAAADALALEAQARWAEKYGGVACDDITVAVAFLPSEGCAAQ